MRYVILDWILEQKKKKKAIKKINETIDKT